MKVKTRSLEYDYEDYDRNNLPEAIIEELGDAFIEMMILGLANGIFLELKIESYCDSDFEILKKLLVNVGNARLVKVEDIDTSNLYLYEEGFDIYKQGSENYFFIKNTERNK